MIKETNDINQINFFLNHFDVEFSENPFRKYLVYDNKGILIYSKIYDRIEIDYIYVITDFRRKSIASKLMNHLFSMELGSCSLEVRCDNKVAINLYKKYGFEIVTVRKNYYASIDGYLMVRK